MAESNWSPDRTGMNDANIDELDFIGYHVKDDNNENGIRKLNLKKMSLRNSQIIYILHLYVMSNFEYILRVEKFIFIFCAYILVNNMIKIFLKDRMRRFFKHS